MCPAFGCGVRHWPLAIMLSADRVPVKSSRSKRPGPSGVSRSVDRLAWVRYRSLLSPTSLRGSLREFRFLRRAAWLDRVRS
jgi:hypothetical protein